MHLKKHDADDKPLGQFNDNPILDSCKYDVQFLDGSIGFAAKSLQCRAVVRTLLTDLGSSIPNL
jgi:hypothetical protein